METKNYSKLVFAKINVTFVYFFFYKKQKLLSKRRQSKGKDQGDPPHKKASE